MPRYLEHRDYLELIPEHMHESICWWIEKGEPHPGHMGTFLGALLSNDLMEAFARADSFNIGAMHAWTIFLYNYAPGPCFGSPAKMQAWWEHHHPATTPGEPTAPASTDDVEPHE